MKLLNVSSKVVFVGYQMLMPDHSIEVDEKVLDTPSVQVLLNTNPPILSVDNSAELAAQAQREQEEMRERIAAEERAKIEAEMKAKAEAEKEEAKREETPDTADTKPVVPKKTAKTPTKKK